MFIEKKHPKPLKMCKSLMIIAKILLVNAKLTENHDHSRISQVHANDAHYIRTCFTNSQANGIPTCGFAKPEQFPAYSSEHSREIKIALIERSLFLLFFLFHNGVTFGTLIYGFANQN